MLSFCPSVCAGFHGASVISVSKVRLIRQEKKQRYRKISATDNRQDKSAYQKFDDILNRSLNPNANRKPDYLEENGKLDESDSSDIEKSVANMQNDAMKAQYAEFASRLGVDQTESNDDEATPLQQTDSIPEVDPVDYSRFDELLQSKGGPRAVPKPLKKGGKRWITAESVTDALSLENQRRKAGKSPSATSQIKSHHGSKQSFENIDTGPSQRSHDAKISNDVPSSRLDNQTDFGKTDTPSLMKPPIRPADRSRSEERPNIPKEYSYHNIPVPSAEPPLALPELLQKPARLSDNAQLNDRGNNPIGAEQPSLDKLSDHQNSDQSQVCMNEDTGGENDLSSNSSSKIDYDSFDRLLRKSETTSDNAQSFSTIANKPATDTAKHVLQPKPTLSAKPQRPTTVDDEIVKPPNPEPPVDIAVGDKPELLAPPQRSNFTNHFSEGDNSQPPTDSELDIEPRPREKQTLLGKPEIPNRAPIMKNAVLSTVTDCNKDLNEEPNSHYDGEEEFVQAQVVDGLDDLSSPDIPGVDEFENDGPNFDENIMPQQVKLIGKPVLYKPRSTEKPRSRFEFTRRRSFRDDKQAPLLLTSPRWIERFE